MQKKHILNIGLRYFYIIDEDLEIMIERLRDSASQQAVTIEDFVENANSKSKIRWIEKEVSFQDLTRFHKFISQFYIIFARQISIGEKPISIGIGRMASTDNEKGI